MLTLCEVLRLLGEVGARVQEGDTMGEAMEVVAARYALPRDELVALFEATCRHVLRELEVRRVR